MEFSTALDLLLTKINEKDLKQQQKIEKENTSLEEELIFILKQVDIEDEEDLHSCLQLFEENNYKELK